MKGIDFPIVKTKPPKSSREFDLTDPAERKVYFQEKVPKEIAELKDYFRDNTFVAYLLGKKMAGKGTYTKLLAEIFGSDLIKHLSVGDLVRATDQVKDDQKAKDELFNYLEKNYRGFIPLEEAFEAFINRDTSTLLPTEFILALVKREIELAGRVNLFIDGFPRNMDQISYSLYFRDLINYRNDPDIFVLIDLPEAVINERIKFRRICPVCNSSRHLTLFPTSLIEYDEENNEYFIKCDNPECEPHRMVGKEGDDKGIEVIKDRLVMDDELIRKAFGLHGVPKVLLRNAVPLDIVGEMVDDFEITKEYVYSGKGKDITVEQKEWIMIDDNGIESVSLLPSAVVVEFIKQLHSILIG
ncbi:MAG: nucleoside monophosphate kinase [Candidatus Dojkabacteria bacterium]|nr:MAG: nucleoside monophosphate kinase [Candidatus Dojkabacteria bacterium]